MRGNALPDFSRYPLLTVVLMLVMGSLAAPLTEEPAFRGYCQVILEREFRGPVAVIISSVLFALAHGPDTGFLVAQAAFLLSRGRSVLVRRPKAGEIEVWIDQLAHSYQVLAMDTLCFREWARLMEGQGEHLLEDVMIAATARIHQLTVATRNERDFAHLDVQVLNPFKTAP